MPNPLDTAERMVYKAITAFAKHTNDETLEDLSTALLEYANVAYIKGVDAERKRVAKALRELKTNSK